MSRTGLFGWVCTNMRACTVHTATNPYQTAAAASFILIHFFFCLHALAPPCSRPFRGSSVFSCELRQLLSDDMRAAHWMMQSSQPPLAIYGFIRATKRAPVAPSCPPAAAQRPPQAPNWARAGHLGTDKASPDLV